MKIIGITGPIGAGKTTIAKYLEENHGYKLLSFSTLLKKAAAELFSIDLHHFYDPDLKNEVNEFWKLTPRSILQVLGTECMRDNFGQDFWAKSMMQHINQSNYKAIVIDDVRFTQESAMICRLDGDIIKVIRKENPYAMNDAHISENVKIIYDFLCVNNFALNTLYNHIDGIMQSLET